MNVVIHARYSSRSQTEQSIEGQLKACYDYAKVHDYIVVGEYIDRSLTGTNDKRPEFQKMMNNPGAEPTGFPVCPNRRKIIAHGTF